jgi:hypothetical protein
MWHGGEVLLLLLHHALAHHVLARHSRIVSNLIKQTVKEFVAL